MASGPLTDAERRKIKKLHAEGKGRNEIATMVGRSKAAVSKVIAATGQSFARGEEVKAATAAKVLDAKARRAQLQLDLLADAERLRRQLFESARVHSFGGKDHDFAVAVIPEPTFADKRNIVQAVVTVINASIAIDRHDRAGAELSGVDAYLAARLGPADDDAQYAAYLAARQAREDADDEDEDQGDGEDSG
jgi:hypothetical protein